MMLLTEEDLSKYPFLPQATDYVKQLDLDINELTETLNEILKRAEQRVEVCLDPAIGQAMRFQALRNPSIEIPSFPVAVIIANALKSNYLKKRYALCEAKKIFENLKREQKKKVFEIAKFFKWDIRPVTSEKKNIQHFALDFVNYIRNTTSLRQPEWKLINRKLIDGRISLTKSELCRLLQEEVQRYIEAKLNSEIPELPPAVTVIIEQLKTRFSRKTGDTQMVYPHEMEPNAFPPCIKSLQISLLKGHHLSHIGRFTLTTFFVNVGMAADDVVNLFRSLSDFNERLTVYQVEHIAGEKGSGTKYTPPTCSTLQTHRVCVDRDEGCRRIKHPLAYYRKA
ncbi:DNA primase large subunit PriL, partial [Candidatus Bathyarchaeota archaeon]|nr:DNA primase large subunit PriL [Candidatus Bathyarchaeota archaeon]